LVKVLLVDVDSKIANLALMKISSYHKSKGDEVFLYRHRAKKNFGFEFFDVDPGLVYVSCLFTWNRPLAQSINNRFRGKPLLYGGTGFDHGRPASERNYLPDVIEYASPDYDLYGNDYALGFCLRGCNRKCQFCDVPLKEGRIKLADYRPPWTWVPDGFTKAMLLDNDPALYPDKLHDEIFRWFMSSGVRCSITQGYDIRCVTPERAALLAELNPYDLKFHDHRLYIAWDYLGVEGFIRERIPMLLDAGIKGVNISCYMITGFAPATKGPDRCPWDGADLTGPHAADLHRYEVLWKDFGVLPFVMVYNNERGDPWLRAFARFINRRVFKHTEWADYRGWLPEKATPPDRGEKIAVENRDDFR